MKKNLLSAIAIAVVAMLLVVATAGCSKEPAPNNENNAAASLSELQGKIQVDGKLFGVAYLGYVDYDAELNLEEFKKQEYVKALPFIENINECAENEGYRVYAIVPSDDEVTITVSKCEFDDEYMPFAGEVLVETSEPILIRGNVSDTIPNLYVVAKKGDLAVEYTPVQSGMDGKLENSENKVYDFTPYDKMTEFEQ